MRTPLPLVAEPLELGYREPPRGDVCTTDAALRPLARTRPWALACTVGMFT